MRTIKTVLAATALLCWVVVTQWQIGRRVTPLVERLGEMEAHNVALQRQIAALAADSQPPGQAGADAETGLDAGATSALIELGETSALDIRSGSTPGQPLTALRGSSISSDRQRRLDLLSIGTTSNKGCILVNAFGKTSPLTADMSGAVVQDGASTAVVTVTGTNARLPNCFIVYGHTGAMALTISSCSSMKVVSAALSEQVVDYKIINAGTGTLTVGDGTRTHAVTTLQAVTAYCVKSSSTTANVLYFLDTTA
mmetsp:Transcript_133359/g.243027  ORF Transcript_133359/g.243027 Transcript_133359/m.243027 type:complete len:254 (+) Transcript_133359:61-822(+)